MTITRTQALFCPLPEGIPYWWRVTLYSSVFFGRDGNVTTSLVRFCKGLHLCFPRNFFPDRYSTDWPIESKKRNIFLPTRLDTVTSPNGLYLSSLDSIRGRRDVSQLTNPSQLVNMARHLSSYKRGLIKKITVIKWILYMSINSGVERQIQLVKQPVKIEINPADWLDFLTVFKSLMILWVTRQVRNHYHL